MDFSHRCRATVALPPARSPAPCRPTVSVGITRCNGPAGCRRASHALAIKRSCIRVQDSWLAARLASLDAPVSGRPVLAPGEHHAGPSPQHRRRPDHAFRRPRRARNHPARDDAGAGEDRALVGVQSRARLFDGTVQRDAGDDPAGPGHSDPSGLAHSGDEGGRQVLRGRHPRGRPDPPQRSGLWRQPRDRYLHV